MNFSVIVLASFSILLGSLSLHAAPIVQTHAVSTGTEANAPLTVEQRLSRCVQLAHSKDVEEAFDYARATKKISNPDHLFPTKYIDTLTTIASHADPEMAKQILADAVTQVTILKTRPEYTGHNSAELAYHFMVSVGKVGDGLLPLQQDQAIPIKIQQGEIARGLRHNPGYPQDAHASLSGALISKAQAHALNSDQTLAMEAVTEACELGFCEFEQLTSDTSFAKLTDQAGWSAHLGQLEKSYLVKVQKWSEKEIREFKRFRFDFKVADVSGGSLTQQDYRGKLMVIDLWATWCAPCRQGIPHFVRLQKEHQQQGVQVLGISMDSPDDPNSSLTAVREFMDENHFNYPCGLGTKQVSDSIPGDVKLPTTLFLDREGNVRYIATGYHDYAKLSAIVDTLANEGQRVRTTTAQ